MSFPGEIFLVVPAKAGTHASGDGGSPRIAVLDAAGVDLGGKFHSVPGVGMGPRLRGDDKILMVAKFPGHFWAFAATMMSDKATCCPNCASL